MKTLREAPSGHLRVPSWSGRLGVPHVIHQVSKRNVLASPGSSRLALQASSVLVRPEVSVAEGPAELKSRLVTPQTLADHKSMFCSVLYEYEYWVDDAWVEGSIPAELEGTYFRNGPGMQINNGKVSRHTFDGDGMVVSLAIKDGRAYFRNKYVRTKGFVAEQAAGRPLFRSTFSSGAADGGLFNPFDLKFKNVANTGAVYWAGKLYALWEAGLPHELDPRTLDTLGETNMKGLIGDRLAGHYRVTREADGSRRWCTFSTNIQFSGNFISFFEFDESGRRVAHSSHPLKGVDITFVHDMVVSENWYIVVLGPIEFDRRRFAAEYLLGRCSIAQCLKYNENLDTQVMLFPRPGRPGSGQRSPRVLRTPQPFFPFHHVNAYEADGGQRIVIDTVAWDDVTFDIHQFNVQEDYYVGGSRAEYFRLDVDLRGPGTVMQRRLLHNRTVEFPAMHPDWTGRPHSHAYFMADTVGHHLHWGPGQAIVKVELGHGPGTSGRQGDEAVVAQQMWEAGPRCFLGEPLFVPRPNSRSDDDGWILVAKHDAASMKASFVILDAQDLKKGPLATIHLPHLLPASLHGSFTPEYLGPDPRDESVPRWKQPVPVRDVGAGL
eukprot:CAMPEP_0202902346 /NCGR_PEP_ID=MMETSP1392-20130828/16799_1 /ASSEMBLY_ACC=CAM_ASM_000868 /TAXON_ID=225041 /ORGANISM="Chlamydomonas chlamydogama, Strain SAG 11-48b" /LENGTH=605 /DNA_ID=CAMNT_0049589095 /DNA_START=178 /DNA_END=1995 /DNA_ORIENTATION=+